MSLYVGNYWAFLLLIFIPSIYFISQKSLSGLSRWRNIFTTTARYILLLLLILALADLQISITSKRLSVLFVLDLSKSIPEQVEVRAKQFIENTIQKMDANDEYGLLVFGEDASFEYLQDKKKRKIEEIQSQIRKDQTDIAGALRLAIAALPNTGQRRIVLLSDGNETVGDAMKQVEQAISDEITIDIVPLTFQNTKEVLIEKMLVPGHVKQGQSYEVTVVTSSQKETTGTLRLFLNGQLIRNLEVRFPEKKGSFDILIPGDWVEEGFHKLKAIISSKDDFIIANNIAEEFIHVRGIPKILYVEDDIANSSYLYNALSKISNNQQLIKVERITPEEIPSNILTLNTYDSIVLSNVAAYQLSQEQMQMIESAVHESGIGLVMIGGEKSFGAGGYRNTPIERALPVDMDIRNRKIIPNGALAVILHTCEFPDGNRKGREICKQAIRRLSPGDYAGVIVYDFLKSTSGWLVPPTLVANKNRIMNAIDNSEAGDMPNFDPALTAAHSGLKNLPAIKKHIIIITDGDPSAPNRTLMKRIVKSKISISTIVINPHTPGDGAFMAEIAKYTGGNFYDVTNSKNLPNIFIKESMVVKNSLIYEEKKVPQMAESTNVIRGFSPGEFPEILGCILTVPKEGLVNVPLYIEGPNKDREPLLAHWQYGLGRTVAFTSDAKNRWAKNWLRWPKYDKFWRQTVRWSMRKVQKNNFKVHTLINKGKGKILIEAIDEAGEYLTQLQMQGRVIKPDGQTDDLIFEQKGLGSYHGEFDLAEVGTYLATIVYLDRNGQKRYLNTGLSLSFSSEYLFNSSNSSLLHQISSQTGGRNLEMSFMDKDTDMSLSKEEWIKDEKTFIGLDIDGDGILDQTEIEMPDIFLKDKPRGGQPKQLWSLFVLVFIILLFVDIFVRRVLLDYQKIWQKLRFRSSEEEASEQTMSQLMQRKQQMRQQMKPSKEIDLKKLESMGRNSSLQSISVESKTTSKTNIKKTTSQQSNVKKPKNIVPKETDYTSRLLAAKKKTWKKSDDKDK